MPNFVTINRSSPAAVSFFLRRLTLTVKVFSSTNWSVCQRVSMSLSRLTTLPRFSMRRRSMRYSFLLKGIFGRRQSAKLGKVPAGKGRKLLMFLCKPPKPHKNKANSEQQAHPRGVQNRPERQLIKKKRKGKNPAKQQKCETEKEL